MTCSNKKYSWKRIEKEDNFCGGCGWPLQNIQYLINYLRVHGWLDEERKAFLESFIN